MLNQQSVGKYLISCDINNKLHLFLGHSLSVMLGPDALPVEEHWYRLLSKIVHSY